MFFFYLCYGHQRSNKNIVAGAMIPKLNTHTNWRKSLSSWTTQFIWPDHQAKEKQKTTLWPHLFSAIIHRKRETWFVGRFDDRHQTGNNNSNDDHNNIAAVEEIVALCWDFWFRENSERERSSRWWCPLLKSSGLILLLLLIILWNC